MAGKNKLQEGMDLLRRRLREPLEGEDLISSQIVRDDALRRKFRRKKGMSTKNVILRRLSQVFDFYSGGKDFLDRGGVKQMLVDLGMKKGMDLSKLVDRAMSEMDVHRGDGEITFAEFVSFATMSQRELVDVAFALRRSLKNGKNASLQRAFDLFCDLRVSRNTIDQARLEMSCHKKLNLHLTPGELHKIASFIGPGLKEFKRFLKEKPDRLRQIWLSKSSWVTGLALSPDKVDKHFVELEPSCNDSASRPKFKVWVRLEEAMNAAAGRFEILEPQEDSNSETSSSDDDEGEDKHQEETISKPTTIPPLQNLEVAIGSRNAGLVADGFQCLDDKSLNRTTMKSKAAFLWVKRVENLDGSDAILEIAVTVGNMKNRESALWSPPSRSFKRIEWNFGKPSRAVFIWYRKRDPTFQQEVTKTQRLNFSHKESRVSIDLLKRRVREQVREIVRCSSDRGNLDLEAIFDEISGGKDKITKRMFVASLIRIGIQLEAADLAEIFAYLETASSDGVALKDDILEFFELSDEEIHLALNRLRLELKAKFGKKMSPLDVFHKFDVDNDGIWSGVEFRNMIESLGIHLADEEVQRALEDLDVNSSGQVELDDFLQFHSNFSQVKGSGQRELAVLNALHELCLKLATVGQNSGKLRKKLNIENAWAQLVGNESYLTSRRLTKVFANKGRRFRKQDIQNALVSLQEGMNGLSHQRFKKFFESFNVSSAPVEIQQGQTNWSEFMQRFHRDLRNFFHANDKNESQVFQKLWKQSNQREMTFDEFLHGIRKFGSVRDARNSDLLRLNKYLDKDNDGFISVKKIKRFMIDPEWNSHEESVQDKIKLVPKQQPSEFKQGWVRHMRNPGLKRRKNGLLNVNLIKASVEKAASENGGPLELRNLFSKNGRLDGTCSVRRFRKVLKNCRIAIPKTEQQALQDLLLLDDDHVDFEVFCEIVGESSEIEAPDIEAVHRRIVKAFAGLDFERIFSEYDQRGDGLLDEVDLHEICNIYRIAISEWDWDFILPFLRERNDKINCLKLCELLEQDNARNRRSENKIERILQQRFFKENIEGIALQFEKLDEFGIGFVNPQQATWCLKRHHGNLAQHEIRNVISEFDTIDGKFDYLSFLSAVESIEDCLKSKFRFQKKLYQDCNA